MPFSYALLVYIAALPIKSFASDVMLDNKKQEKIVLDKNKAGDKIRKSNAEASKHNEQIEVVASRTDMTGRATTASQGTVTAIELQTRPAYRVGQILEAVPGLVVTTHSGEGKANQFLLRGFNLDHGTDLATFVDDMPINGATNAHGQGYTDINFIMPEVLGGVDFTKGSYYANVGDFGVAGSDHMKLASEIANQVFGSAGTLGDYRAFIGGTVHLKNGDKWVNAFSWQHADGPWKYADNATACRQLSRMMTEANCTAARKVDLSLS